MKLDIPRELVLACCKALVDRNNNGGMWIERKIPDCFLEARKILHLENALYEIDWLLIVENAMIVKGITYWVSQNHSE